MSGSIIGLDPGPTHSAAVLLEGGVITYAAKRRNEELFAQLRFLTMRDPNRVLVIEMIASYGMAVGAEIFETVFWIGRFYEFWHGFGQVERMFRREVKLHLCGSMKAKDANVRQALIDRYGPGKAAAIGTKKEQGPLYGLSGDLWSALAIAVTFSDRSIV